MINWIGGARFREEFGLDLFANSKTATVVAKA